MRLYTKTGDGGETGLIGGARVTKDSLVIAAVGDLDELNCLLGVVRSHQPQPDLEERLNQIQSLLFDCGAEVASSGDYPAHLDAICEALESDMDAHELELPPLKNFILPAGAPPAAALHQARAICRRAERSLVALSHNQAVRPALLAFVNRLSDWLFSSARVENHRRGVEEVVWRKQP